MISFTLKRKLVFAYSYYISPLTFHEKKLQKPGPTKQFRQLQLFRLMQRNLKKRLFTNPTAQSKKQELHSYSNKKTLTKKALSRTTIRLRFKRTNQTMLSKKHNQHKKQNGVAKFKSLQFRKGAQHRQHCSNEHTQKPKVHLLQLKKDKDFLRHIIKLLMRSDSLLFLRCGAGTPFPRTKVAGAPFLYGVSKFLQRCRYYAPF